MNLNRIHGYDVTTEEHILSRLYNMAPPAGSRALSIFSRMMCSVTVFPHGKWSTYQSGIFFIISFWSTLTNHLWEAPLSVYVMSFSVCRQSRGPFVCGCTASSLKSESIYCNIIYKNVSWRVVLLYHSNAKTEIPRSETPLYFTQHLRYLTVSPKLNILYLN
jgi:hypothetical protein